MENQISQKIKGGNTMHKLNWKISIPQYDKQTNQRYYKQIDLQYKQEAILQNIAYIIITKHNQPIYDKETKGKYWTTKQVINKYKTYPHKEKQRVIDTYIEEAYKNYTSYLETQREKQELEQVKKLAIREKQLTQYQEQVDNYFNNVELAKENKLKSFIDKVKQQDTATMAWFRSLSYQNQEAVVNKVDNYLHQQEEILVGNQELLETVAYKGGK